MSEVFDRTHKRILESGKKLFIEKGYERTNLRELSRAAGVTTGSFYKHFKSKEEIFSALVEPVLSGFNKLYNESSDVYYEEMDREHLSKMWELSYDTVVQFMDFIYSYFDEFKLLLQCADGTSYSNFLDGLVKQEVESSYKVMEIMKSKGLKVKDIRIEEFHMLIHSYYSCLFEVVFHDMDKEQALLYVRTIVDFFTAGWKTIFLGI
ncbi:MAG: TetR/AcrR family transcriptional regulator [Treponemataceae bacterium]|nr:TetR/AcrR family transcriptional regulator [Treponemataceae bacterium]